MLVAASLGLGTRLVTARAEDLELAYAECGGMVMMTYSEGRGYDLHTSNFGVSSWIRILLLYHCTTEMKLRVNENIIIDSIDELR